jgi:hypothetical protein
VADEIEERGFVAVKVAGTEVRLDLWEVNNRIVEIRGETADQPANAFNTAMVAYLKGLGYPAVSTRTACLFANRIAELTAGLEKKAESAESPSPNAS